MGNVLCNRVGYEVSSAKCGVQSVKCGVQSVECGVQSVECGVQSVECGVQSGEDGDKPGNLGVLYFQSHIQKQDPAMPFTTGDDHARFQARLGSTSRLRGFP